MGKGIDTPCSQASRHPADNLHALLAGAVWADIQQVWTNCRLFNAAASPICKLCAESEDAMLRKWAAAGLPIPGQPHAPGAGALAPTPAQPKRKKQKLDAQVCD